MAVSKVSKWVHPVSLPTSFQIREERGVLRGDARLLMREDAVNPIRGHVVNAPVKPLTAAT